MAYFTKEQTQYLENIGFERIRDNGYWMSFQDCFGHVLIESYNDAYRAEVETTHGVDSVVEGDNLKKVVRSALRRYKYKAKDIQKMVNHIDEIYSKTEGIPKMSEAFFDEEEVEVIKRLEGTAYTNSNNEPEFMFKKYGLVIFVTKVKDLNAYFCEVKNPKLPIKAVMRERNIFYAIEAAMHKMQQAMRPYILTDAATKFIEDDIKKEFP